MLLWIRSCMVATAMLSSGAFVLSAQNLSDTVQLQEISVTSFKQGLSLRGEALAATLVTRAEAERMAIKGIKGISDVVPNFYIPDYGSRITSSIYVRGLGARMDQPAVGLNVDNIPFLNKDAYDFDITDIARIEMIRGPQSTLYGRNTIGGLINITTLSPLNYTGFRGLAEYGSANTWRLSGGYYFRPVSNFGISASLAYAASDGFFTNEYTGQKLDFEKQWSGRVRADWIASRTLTLSNSLNFSRLRQGGYPYEYVNTGEIAFNDPCFYNRFCINDGVTATMKLPFGTLVTVTSVQHINDNMTLDQDFLPLDYFTLTQKKDETAFTQDVVVKGEIGNKIEWLGGAFGFGKWLDMSAPVTFADYGIKKLIEEHRNSSNPDYPITWDSREFPLNSEFDIPTWGLAAYTEWKLNTGNWRFTAGVRLDYERTLMHSHSYCSTGYTIMHREQGQWMPYRHVDIDIDDKGSISRHFLEVLPKFSVLYMIPSSQSNVYFNFSKGYKAGGFNTQMFSDVLQQRLMNIMGIGAQYDIDQVVGYKPEKSWNFEIGSHISALDGKFNAELSAFYILVEDQQLTMFPDGTTTGRIMTNAGRTRSFGAEAQLSYQPLDNVRLSASYGYTNATFSKFFNGKEDFKGKYLPYAPMQTLFAQAVWRLPIDNKIVGGITFDVNMQGVGKIYWNESNSLHQPFYALLNASATIELGAAEVELWAKNITDTSFSTFYFVSIGNEFVQRGKPFRGGVTLTLNI